MKKYGVKVVPTTVIDGEIKVVGIPDFPWICGDDLYTITVFYTPKIFESWIQAVNKNQNTKSSN